MTLNQEKKLLKELKSVMKKAEKISKKIIKNQPQIEEEILYIKRAKTINGQIAAAINNCQLMIKTIS